jgi:Zn-dependent protease with chaperone function
MVEGRYYFPHSARCVPARVAIAEGRLLRITTPEGEALAEVSIRVVKISSRLGDVPRRIRLPDGATFETGDNDGIDDMLREARWGFGRGWVNRLESSWGSVAISVAFACAAAAAFVIWGIPATARVLALETPPTLATMVSDQTLEIMDGHYLKPSKLSDADKARAQALFDRVAAVSSCGAFRCTLVFREGALIGANAFALPDGRIVLTDQLWKMIKSNDEIEGVFAHEMSHVAHAHGLQRVYEASLVPATIAVVTGDVSQVSQFAVILPGILMQSAYSRDFESQADADAVQVLRRIGARPSAMGDLLERLERTKCGKDGCGPNWLGDHPETRRRVEMFRSR